MCRIYIYIVIFGMFNLTASSQESLSTPHMKSNNPLPVGEFKSRQTAVDQYEEQNENFVLNRKKFEKQRLKNFESIAASSSIKVLTGGRISLGDSITRYLNRIRSKLIQNDDSLLKKSRIFLARSGEVNAFAYGDGTIIINSGLISRIPSEAELAFIIAHELVHLKMKHQYEQYAKINRPSQEVQKLRTSSDGSELFTVHNYSQQQELEADAMALEMVSLAGYDLRGMAAVFDVLGKSYLPNTEDKFDVKVLETGSYSLPKRCYLDSLSTVIAYENLKHFDKIQSTHPVPSVRKVAASKKIKRLSSSDVKWVVSKSDFERYKQACGDYDCRAYAEAHKYREALTMVEKTEGLSQRDRRNFIGNVLQRIPIVIALGWSEEVVNKTTGPLAQVEHVFQNLSHKEQLLLAILYCWENYKTNEKKYEQLLFKRAVLSYLNEYNNPWKKFTKDLRKLTSLGWTLDDSKLSENTKFRSAYALAYSAHQYALDINAKQNANNRYSGKLFRQYRKGRTLDYKCVGIINPIVLKYELDKSKQENIQFYTLTENAIQSAQLKKVVGESYQYAIKKLKLPDSLLAPAAMSRTHGDYYQFMVEAQSFCNQISTHDVLQTVPFNYETVRAGCRKYGFQALVSSSFIRQVQLLSYQKGLDKIVVAAIDPATIPWALHEVGNIMKVIEERHYVCNVSNASMDMRYYSKHKSQELTRSEILMGINDLLIQIHAKP